MKPTKPRWGKSPKWGIMELKNGPNTKFKIEPVIMRLYVLATVV